ncbi:MAG TPA: nodulation protein NfeD [Candidatus Latescibacteria bacterium]|nr:nodulation protein NfeD [Candidatus Handelsmanbacteria bacterium]HIL08658.1 nodulation protein NfeD [Candidatus Latescibacterota bacterium]
MKTMRHIIHIVILLSCTASLVQAQTVYHVNIKLEGMIDPGVAAFIERVIEDAEAAEVDAIVFEIDTFGGRVDAATVIRDAILDANALTIAFVNKRAISAGALISLACDKIVMTQASTMGATTPVDGSGTKGSDKTVSYMRAEMRATAERTGRDVKIAEAMVDERIDVPGLSAEAGRPATLTTEQALNYQIADETAETLIELLKIYDLGDAEIVEIELNWAEHVLRMLTNPVVTSILLAVAMFGLISEVRTPGWGIGGTLSLVALGLFFGSHLIVHLAEWQELGLFAVGLALLILEVVAIPGFGLVGLAGVGAMLASLVMTQLGDYQLWSIDEIAVVTGRLAASMIGAIILSVVLLRSLSKFAAFNRLVLQSETPAADGYVSSSREHDVDLVGSEGVSVSDLRPAGIGLIAGERIGVMTDGEFIEAQRAIVVVEARGSRVVVKAL